MDAFTTAVLAALVTAQPPGKSIHSQVTVDADAPPACTSPSLLCRPPRFNKKYNAFVRAETKAEGMLRYRIIARAIAKAAAKDRGLARLMVVVAAGESGLRRDVHLGLTRGDKGKSWGLFQQLGDKLGERRVHEGWKLNEIVGDDDKRTLRAATVAARQLKRARRVCRWRRKGCTPYGIYGGGVAISDPRIQLRLRIEARVRRVL